MRKPTCNATSSAVSRQKIPAGTGCPIDGHALFIPSDASQTCILLGLGDISLISKAMELHITFSNTQTSLYKNTVNYLHRKGAGDTHIWHHLVNLQIFIERVLHGRHCVIRLWNYWAKTNHSLKDPEPPEPLSLKSVASPWICEDRLLSSPYYSFHISTSNYTVSMSDEPIPTSHCTTHPTLCELFFFHLPHSDFLNKQWYVWHSKI